MSASLGEVWEVVGGADKGGIIVRRAHSVSSEVEAQRLSKGALLRGLELRGERLHFQRLAGVGPETGWVLIRLKGKDLVVKSSKLPSAEEAVPPSKGGDRQAGTPEARESGTALAEAVKEKFDPYKLLGVDYDATDAKIQSTFRKASLTVHPDRRPDDLDAARKFRELKEAKEFLLNPFKRRLYNFRHGLLKPTVGQVWWSDWDTILAELAAPAGDELEDRGDHVPRGPGVAGGGGPADLLIFGATGLTGTLACSLLAQGLWGGRSWVICGRDERKLELLEKRFGGGAGFGGARRVETREEILQAVQSVRIVVDLSGPSREIGITVAEACVQAGRHYVDNTGEVDFSKTVKDRLSASAEAAGVCLLLHSGYCSVPVDLGVWHMVKHLREKHKVSTRRVDAYDATSGMVLSGTNYVSGGIWGGEDTRGLDPFMLGGLRSCGLRPDDQERDTPYEDGNTGGYSILAAVSDRLVVRSSCGLFDGCPEAYGANFAFRNWAVFADQASATNGIMMSRIAQRMFTGLVKQKKIPPVRHGPGERVRQECLTTRVFVAEADEPGKRPRKAYCVMNAGPGGFGDRYEGTASMSVEAACTLLDAEDAGQKASLRPGWGTPAYHLAHLGFLDRLVARGARFRDVVDGAPSHEFFQNILGAAMALEEQGCAQ